MEISKPFQVQNVDHNPAAKVMVMAPYGSITGTMPFDIVVIFMCPWERAPIAEKKAKRSIAFLGVITLAPTAVSQGVAASFAPKFHAIKKDRTKPIINRIWFSTIKAPSFVS
jgi:hypothetical protein